jgi:hypothetical protein
MANLVISAAGAAVGYLVGGPTGASIGWTLGSAFSSNGGADSMSASQVGDLRVQTSQYGVVIPVCVGKQRVSGNVFWAADKVPHTTETEVGGKGGGGGGAVTTSTTYSVSMAIGICKGPILGVSRVWADGKLIIDATNDAKPLIGNLYLGNNSQLADATMTNALGAGEVPAYRGLAYIVLDNFDLGVTGRIPNFSFEVLKEGGI